MTETERTVARVGLGIAIMTALTAAILGELILALLAALGAALLLYAQMPDEDEQEGAR